MSWAAIVAFLVGCYALWYVIDPAVCRWQDRRQAQREADKARHPSNRPLR